MEIKKITDPAFKKYGRIISDVDFSGLVDKLMEATPLPEDVAYVASVPELEALPFLRNSRPKFTESFPFRWATATATITS